MESVYGHLLAQIKAVKKKYEGILDATGERYNIFQILKMQSAENRLHSAFLANLLDPKGTHGFKDLFLQLFIKTVVTKEFPFDSSTACVEREKHVGFLNADNTEGGRIDICLTDGPKNQILIENKIYAADKKNQLLRYSNYNKNAYLIYLCLSKKKVSEFSCKELEADSDYYIVTYKNEIIDWLILCKKEATSQPILRETISQYINLIKALTGQTINHTMQKEIIEQIIVTKDTFAASFDIANNLDAARKRLLDDLKVMVEKIGVELKLETKFYLDLNKRYTGFSFYKQEWNTAKVAFQFQGCENNLIYGVSRNKECNDLNDELTTLVFNRLAHLGGAKTSRWLFRKDVEEKYADWSKKNPWMAIIDTSIKTYIRAKVEEVLKPLDGLSL